MKKMILLAAMAFLFAASAPLAAQCGTGDLNNDGKISIADFSIIATVLSCGDMDGDNDVDGCDSMIIRGLAGFPAANGDTNNNGGLDQGDVDDILAYLGFTGTAPSPLFCCCLADVNCDGTVDIADAIYLSNYLNGSGPAPCPLPPCPGSCP